MDLVLAADTPLEQKLSVFPNPAHDCLEVRLPDRPGRWLLQLANTHGQEVWRNTTTETSVTLEVSGLPAGVYYLYVSGKGDLLHESIIIE